MEETVDPLATLFEGLSRDPDLDAPELQAYDAADTLILRTAAPALGGLDPASWW
ncbi:hypothetical protein [Leucobacter insecticola]|uniref:hypothetical protein n=1 Tax=Leucobacter insecticola TaxID=2714934 RepID=UPI0031379175